MEIEEKELNMQNLHCTCYLIQEALEKNISEFRDFLQLTVTDFFQRFFMLNPFLELEVFLIIDNFYMDFLFFLQKNYRTIKIIFKVTHISIKNAVILYSCKKIF